MALKKMYAAWELPAWNSQPIEVIGEYTRHKGEKNERNYWVLSTGKRSFHVSKPKNKTWANVKVNDKIFITKKIRTATSAILEVWTQPT